jgi:hypothetical protein
MREMKIDGKFSCDGERIFNTVSGEAIPADEPVFMLRGRDATALQALHSYAKLCQMAGCNQLHLDGIDQTINKFTAFAVDHPERMKQPGVTRHLKLD